jgi:ankyrin repeat protein
MHLIKLLIDRGAKLSKFIDGETPLHWACYIGNKTLIYYLLEKDYTFLYKKN